MLYWVAICLSILIGSSHGQFVGDGGFGPTPTIYTFSDGSSTSTGDIELNEQTRTAFGRNDIVSVVVGSGVTSLGRDAFAWVSSLTNIVIPAGVINIGEGALAGTAITSINIPSTVTNIGVSAFQACSGLTNVVIPNSVINIDRYAFLDCTNLNNVTIGQNVSSLGHSVFANCSNLTTVKFYGNAPSLEAGGGWVNSPAVVYRFSGANGWGSSLAGRPVIIYPFPLSRPSNILTLVGYGGNAYGQSQIPQEASSLTAVSSGVYHNLGLKSDGTVVGWGWNGSGQLNIPFGLSNVVAVSAGAYHSAALKADGTVTSWGSGQDGTMTDSPSGLSDVVSISYGPSASHILALKSDGKLVAWGWNDRGQCNIPLGLSNVVSVSAGTYHSVALKSDGTLVSWGDNNFGQQNLPVGLTNIVAISCSERGTIALKNDYSIISWGDSTVAIPAGVSPVSKIKAGRFNNAIIKNDGSVVTFGEGAPNMPTNLPAVYDLSVGTDYIIAIYNVDPNQDLNSDGVSNGAALSLGYEPSYNFSPIINHLKNNPPAGLFNQSQYDSNRVTGRNDVINSPNSYSLYTTDQIQNLGLGGIILNRNTNNQLVLNYQILQSTDLQNWSSYQNNELVISNAPTNKMFLRVQAVGQ